MKASDLVVRLIEAAPVAPPKPTTKPTTIPYQPEEPKRRKFPSPWRRKEIRPGEEPAPKACRESAKSRAKALITGAISV